MVKPCFPWLAYQGRVEFNLTLSMCSEDMLETIRKCVKDLFGDFVRVRIGNVLGTDHSMLGDIVGVHCVIEDASCRTTNALCFWQSLCVVPCEPS